MRFNASLDLVLPSLAVSPSPVVFLRLALLQGAVTQFFLLPASDIRMAHKGLKVGPGKRSCQVQMQCRDLRDSKAPPMPLLFMPLPLPHLSTMLALPLPRWWFFP